MDANFRRALLISELKSKFAHWQKPGTKDFYCKNLNSNQTEPDFGILRDDNGYFYLSDNLVSYCHLRNGTVSRIRKNFGSSDWKCYNDLHFALQTSGDFRIDIPLYREEILIDNNVWEYAELQSPNNDYGLNFNDDVFNWPELIDGVTPNPSIDDNLRNSVESYFNEYIDQSTKLVKKALTVAQQNKCGLPTGLIEPSNRYKDQNGYFWSDFDADSWNNSKEDLMNMSFVILFTTLTFAKVCGVLDDQRMNNCLQNAREKWTTI